LPPEPGLPPLLDCPPLPVTPPLALTPPVAVRPPVPTVPPLLEDPPPVPCVVLPPEADAPPLPSPCPDEPDEHPALQAATAVKAARTTFTVSRRFVTSRSGRRGRSVPERRGRERPLAAVAHVM